DGNDTLDGGEGSDTYEFGLYDDFDTYQDSGTGASDVDTIKATHSSAAIGINGDFSHSASGIEVIDADGGANVRVLGTSSANNLDFSDVQLINGVRVDAAAGNDTVTTSQVTSDTVFYKGGSGVDTLRIALTLDQAADATLIAQIDALVPGPGVNGVVSAGGLSFSAEGFENIVKGVTVGDSFLPFDNVLIGTPSNDVLDVEAHAGGPTSESYLILGRAGSDVINGSNGDDIIVGEEGNDTLNGGDGNDTFLVAAGDGDDMFDGGAGTDRVVATENGVEIGLRNNFAAGAVEEISANGFDNVEVHGNWQNNTLDFSQTTLTDIDAIDGEGGSDTITGTSQADTIIGGEGNDTLNGGDGDDTFEVGLNHGDDMFDGGAGTDRVVATENGVEIGLRNNFTAGAVEEISANGFDNVEVHGNWQNNTLDFSQTTLTDIDAIDGEGGSDTITGTSQADTIIGGEGNDTLNGGDGDDTFEVGLNHGDDMFDGGAGTDRVVATENGVEIGLRNNFTAGAVEEISANGFDNVEVHGNWQNNTLDFSQTTLTDIDAIDGEGGSDTITGTSQADTIIGGEGNDTLNGGDGDDTFEVGLNHGDDMFDGGAGTDSVVATAHDVEIGLRNNFAAGAVEEISGNGFDNVEVHGNWQNNTLDFSQTTLTDIDAIDGEGGNDTIVGSGGGDTIRGGTGNDSIDGGAGDDTVEWSVGDGRDVVDGGTEDTAGDTFSVTGDGTAEAYGIYSQAEAAAQLSYAGGAEIVITRNGTIIAELSEIEEIVIDGAGGGDTFTTHGSFTGTNLSTSTITVEGTSADDTVDVSELASAHRVVFHANGGNDRVLNARSQDLIDITDQTITAVEDLGGGEYRVELDGGATITFSGTPTFVEHADTDEQEVVNLLPIAKDDAVSGDEDQAGGITGNVLDDNGSGADFDLDNGTLSVVAETKATANGSVSILANGDFTYTPNGDYNGTDTFDYTVSDGQGGSGTASVTVTVAPVNDPAAVTGQDTGSVTEDSVLTASGNLNHTDVDHDNDVWQEVVNETASDNGYGTFTLTSDGQWTYTLSNDHAAVQALNDGQTLTDSFEVLTEDGTSETVSVTINGTDDGNAPTHVSIEGSWEDYYYSYRSSRFGGSRETLEITEQSSLSENVLIQDGVESEDVVDYNYYTSYSSRFYRDGSRRDINLDVDVDRVDASDPNSGFFVVVDASSATGSSWWYGGGYTFSNTSLNWDETTLTITFTDEFGNKADALKVVSVTNSSSRLYDNSSEFSGDIEIVNGHVLNIDLSQSSWVSGGQLIIELGYDSGLSDPIVFDLNGDGVDLSATTAFDIDADGDKDQIGWTGPDDGLLVMDLDGSGAIEDGSEVFSEVFNGGSYANSLEALASLDDNGDGVIDAQDAAYGEIKVWQDANSDGITQDGELQTLIERGIEAINLEAAAVNQTVDGNTVFAEGSYTKDDGSTGTYVGVTFGAANDDSDDTTRQSAAMAAGIALVVYAASSEEVAAGLSSVKLGGALPLNGDVTIADDFTVTYTAVAGFEGNEVVELQLVFADGSIVTRFVELEVLADEASVTGSSTGTDTGSTAVEADDTDGTGSDVEPSVGEEATIKVSGSVIVGDDGNNVLVGTDGDDLLAGGLGADTLTGGDGADTFVLNSLAEADIITDYNFGDGDKIDLGELLDAAFKSGEVAGDLVRATENADGSVRVEVDRDGAGDGHDWQEAATLQDHASMGDTIRVVMDNDGTEVNVSVA
ncbi:beta strand repeat-containing protein, partial [Roseibium sp. SCP14]|uniref:beta strand repeat-containing protein n=1 Tax=Roseibium sp. SCP14 TaxID=3141375 RepID=UPI0033355753